MTRKNPLTKLTDLAVDALKDPRGTAEKALDQVKETTAVARSLATRTAARASDTVSAVAHHTRANRHRGGSAPAPASPTTQASPAPPAPKTKTAPAPRPAPSSRKIAGDPLKPSAKKTAAATQKPAAKKPATKKSAAKQPAAKKSATKTAAGSAHHEPTPADVAPNIAPHPPTAEPASVPGDKLPPRRPAQPQA